MMGDGMFDPAVIEALLKQHISTGCLDNMVSHDVPIFADIIDEIDGRAAMMYAEESLSYLRRGQGSASCRRGRSPIHARCW